MPRNCKPDITDIITDWNHWFDALWPSGESWFEANDRLMRAAFTHADHARCLAMLPAAPGRMVLDTAIANKGQLHRELREIFRAISAWSRGVTVAAECLTDTTFDLHPECARWKFLYDDLNRDKLTSLPIEGHNATAVCGRYAGAARQVHQWGYRLAIWEAILSSCDGSLSTASVAMASQTTASARLTQVTPPPWPPWPGFSDLEPDRFTSHTETDDDSSIEEIDITVSGEGEVRTRIRINRRRGGTDC